MSDVATLPVLVFVRDLIFSSKIIASARSLGVPIQVVRDVQTLLTTSGKALIVDLNQPQNLDAAIGWRVEYGGRVYGFVAHIDTSTIDAAKSGGIDQILTNGAFSRQVDSILTQLK